MRLARATLLVAAAFLGAPAAAGCSEEPDVGSSSPDPRIFVAVDGELGTPSFVRPRRPDDPDAPHLLPGESAGAAALRIARERDDVFRLGDAVGTLVAEQGDGTVAPEDGLRIRHASFAQRHHGIPVLGTRLSFHFDLHGALLFASGRYATDLAHVTTEPTITKADAKAAAGATDPAIAEPTLAIEARAARAHVLVWVVTGVPSTDDAELPLEVIVDATTGEVLRRSPLARDLDATGLGVRAFTSSTLRSTTPVTFDAERIAGPPAVFRAGRVGNGSEIGIRIVHSFARGPDEDVTARTLAGPWDPIAVDVASNLSRADRFFREAGIELGAVYGSAIRVRLTSSSAVPIARHQPDHSLRFDPGGDDIAKRFLPFTGFDVIVHELQHGITASRLGLAADGESAALDESISDVLASLADEANGRDPAHIGEDAVIDAPGYLRSLRDPHRGLVAGAATPAEITAKMSPHAKGGVANNAFWILTYGSANPTTGRSVAAPIGSAAARALYASAVMGRAVSGRATFKDFARALAATAAASDNVTSVACAWRAVDVLDDAEIRDAFGVGCSAASTNAKKAGATCTSESCDARFSGSLCSANGGGTFCCRMPFPVTKVCFDDGDCDAGEICAQASTAPDDEGRSFSCIRPGATDTPCLDGATDAGTSPAVDETGPGPNDEDVIAERRASTPLPARETIRGLATAPAATWKILVLEFASAVYQGNRATMTPADLARAEAAIGALPQEIEHLSNGNLSVELDVVRRPEALTGHTWVDPNDRRSGVWASPYTIRALREAYPGHDAVVVVWKHGAIPFMYGGLTDGELWHSDCPTDTMAAEPNRPYEVIVHELVHQFERFYACSPMADQCKAFKQTQCAGDERYEDGSWMCCYRNELRGNIANHCMTRARIAERGRPTTYVAR